jgi:hypothetical protein
MQANTRKGEHLFPNHSAREVTTRDASYYNRRVRRLWSSSVFSIRCRYPLFLALLATLMLSSPSLCQQSQPEENADAAARSQPKPQSGRILWIIPNNRTSPTLKDYEPLTVRQKFKLALDDSIDRGTFALAGVFAGEAQLTHSSPSFGQGVAG